MADIVAADVTCAVHGKHDFLEPGQSRKKRLIFCRVTIDPGTTDAYPTGGVPLTNLFTAGTGQDLGIDPTFKVMGWATLARISDAVAPAASCHFYNGGTGASDQKLVIGITPKDDGTKSDTLIQYPNEDITTNTTVTTPLANGDKDIVVELMFYGTARADT